MKKLSKISVISIFAIYQKERAYMDTLYSIREFVNSRKLYIRGCFHNKRGTNVCITYKKKPSENGKFIIFVKVTGS